MRGPGCRHLTLKDLRESAEKQCHCCKYLLDSLGGAFDIWPCVRLEDYHDCEADTRLVIKADFQVSSPYPAEECYRGSPLEGIELRGLGLFLEVERGKGKLESKTGPVVGVMAAEGDEDFLYVEYYLCLRISVSPSRLRSQVCPSEGITLP